MFSTSPTTPTALTFAFLAAKAYIKPTTPPAPAISHFISSIPPDGLIEMPPVSKVTPLPTKAIGRSFLCLGKPFHCSAIILGELALPCATPSNAPIPRASIFLSSRTFNFTPSFVKERARLTKLIGKIIFAGSDTRLRVRKTPSATLRMGANFFRLCRKSSNSKVTLVTEGLSSNFS